MSVARQFWRKMKTTMMTRRTASKRVWMISVIPSETASVVSSDIVQARSFGKVGSISSIVFSTASRDGERVRAGRLVDAEDGGGLAVEAPLLVVEERAELDPGDVAQVDLRAVGVRADDDVAELLAVQEAPLRLDRVGELRPRRRTARRRSGPPGSACSAA